MVYPAKVASHSCDRVSRSRLFDSLLSLRMTARTGHGALGTAITAALTAAQFLKAFAFNCIAGGRGSASGQ